MTLAAVFARASRGILAGCSPKPTLLASAPFGRALANVRFGVGLPKAAGARAFSTDISGYNSKVCAVLGGQWGDEGKGKLVDILAGKYDLVCRFNGGANAGHTLVVDGQKFAFHLLPCGMLYEGKVNVIGNGVVVHIPTLLKELEALDDAGIQHEGRLKISDRAHLLIDAHQIVDGMQESSLKDEGQEEIGTTKKGIGPCYSSKTTRNGLRMGDLLDKERFEIKYMRLVEFMQGHYDFQYDHKEELKRFDKYREVLGPHIIDTVHYVNASLDSGKKLLTEGANACLLDVDFGTYPFVTSSSTTAGGISTGLGIAPGKIQEVIGVVKAYTTRVGAGPFPTELHCEIGQAMRDEGHEYGTTTGRPRRCGWLDIPVAKYSHMINGYRSLNITKLDVLSILDEIKVGVAYQIDGERLPDGQMPSSLEGLGSVEVVYETMPGWKCDITKCKTFEELPEAAQKYLERIEELVGVPVSWIGVGPGRDEMAAKGFKLE